jgi:prepilin-type N-terminal cleavage/methylation domain-containing protein
MKLVATIGQRRAGFTLIEVVISSALMAMIIVAAYLCLNACVASQKAMEPRLEVIQNARVSMALMAADLRAACPLDKNSEFLGMARTLGDIEADNLDFATHNYTPRHPHEGDFCEESFYLSPNPETGTISCPAEARRRLRGTCSACASNTTTAWTGMIRGATCRTGARRRLPIAASRTSPECPKPCALPSGSIRIRAPKKRVTCLIWSRRRPRARKSASHRWSFKPSRA